ncbi:MAG: ORF6N domain-containing protein [Chthoniobacterales bacterium]
MKKEIIPASRIADAIHLVRGQKVMLDFDLAALYGVATKVLNQAVGRNRNRFPEDFTFQLTARELSNLRSQFVGEQSSGDERLTPNWSQIVTSSRKHRGTTYRVYAFTEQGVAMLSSVLRSERAVQVNIAIMRAFVQLRAALESNREPARKFSELEERVGKHDEDIGAIIEAIRQLLEPPEKSRREIGFHVRETPSRYGTRKKGR